MYLIQETLLKIPVEHFHNWKYQVTLCHGSPLEPNRCDNLVYRTFEGMNVFLVNLVLERLCAPSEYRDIPARNAAWLDRIA
jgi:hypothetical protein